MIGWQYGCCCPTASATPTADKWEVTLSGVVKINSGNPIICGPDIVNGDWAGNTPLTQRGWLTFATFSGGVYYYRRIIDIYMSPSFPRCNRRHTYTLDLQLRPEKAELTLGYTYEEYDGFDPVCFVDESLPPGETYHGCTGSIGFGGVAKWICVCGTWVRQHGKLCRCHDYRDIILHSVRRVL